MSLQEIAYIDWNKSLVRWNEFTSACYSLTPDAHRILAIAISAIAKDDSGFITFRIYTKQLIDFYPALKNDKNAIARIDEATDSLMRSHIKIKKSKGWLKRHLVHSCQFTRCTSWSYVDIKLSDDMLPYLIGVKGRFSAPKTENVKHLKKDHHFKLHAFLFSYLYRRTTGNVSIEQLRELLNIDKKQYKLVGHLKSRLLIPSIEYINKVTDIHVTMHDVKPSRRIIWFKFDIRKQRIKIGKPESAEISNVSEPKTHLEAQFLAIGLSSIEFSQISYGLDNSYLKQLLAYAKYRATKQTIDSMFKYLKGVLKNKPSIDALLTPQCIIKQKQLKQSQQQEALNAQLDKAEQLKVDEFKQLSLSVEAHLMNCTPDEVKALQQAFADTAFGKSIARLWREIDLDKPYIKAMYYRFVYKKI